MTGTELLAAELTWTGAGFERDVGVEVGADGRIAAVGPLAGRRPGRELAGRALLPGFVNAHSHAFQRGLRGSGERFPEGAGSFWSWREAMYGLVEGLDADGMHALSLAAFREMLATGITTVGEFHYLHHDASNAGFALDRALLAAAREAGIRLVLLNVYYRTGGIGRELAPAQLRFRTRSPGEYWERMEALAAELDPASQSLGAVVHSVRAAELAEIEALLAEARARGLPFHMHVEEQRREIEEFAAVHGHTPLAALNRIGAGAGFTAVHCTHSTAQDLERFLGAGGSVCVCPLTEANLGDGVPALPRAAVTGGSVCVGTDSNARIAFLEELRWLEYAQRLVRERRGVLRDDAGDVARPLLYAGTEAGARSLGLEAGTIRSGAWADLVAVDLGAPALAGCGAGELLAGLLLGAGEGVLAEVCVGGRWRDPGA